MSYPVVKIPPDAREDTEQLGSKPKFWVLLDDGRWLFKEARPHTGEDWAEKVAAELAAKLNISAANVELADYVDRRGCISRNFVNVLDGQALVHGNEILGMKDTGYDTFKKFRQSDHTLENIDSAIRALFPESYSDEILTQLAGYLVLDALIGNTDRHHENWGLLIQVQTESLGPALSVAPSYDHASSLGRELRDERRLELLAGKRVEWYVEKGRGGVFRTAEDQHGENPLRLVQRAAHAFPAFFRPALEHVSALSHDDIHEIIHSLPDFRASLPAKRFAESMIIYSQVALSEILK